MRQIELQGDVELASTLGFLAQHLRWDIEESLSQYVGDILAHRFMQTTRAWHQKNRRTVRRLCETTAEYWLDENPQLVRHVMLTEFDEDMAVLRDAVERLEKRVSHTEAAMRPTQTLNAR
jgi:ubiquinone biosynthesis protein UbiJ